MSIWEKKKFPFCLITSNDRMDFSCALSRLSISPHTRVFWSVKAAFTVNKRKTASVSIGFLTMRCQDHRSVLFSAREQFCVFFVDRETGSRSVWKLSTDEAEGMTRPNRPNRKLSPIFVESADTGQPRHLSSPQEAYSSQKARFPRALSQHTNSSHRAVRTSERPLLLHL